MLQTTQEYIDAYVGRGMLDPQDVHEAIETVMGENYCYEMPLATAANRAIVDTAVAAHMLSAPYGAKCWYIRTQHNVKAVTDRAVAAAKEDCHEPTVLDDDFLWAKAEKVAEVYVMMAWYGKFVMRRREDYQLLHRLREAAFDLPGPVDLGGVTRLAALLLSCFDDEFSDDAVKKALTIANMPRPSRTVIPVMLYREGAPCGDGAICEYGTVSSQEDARDWEELTAAVTLPDGSQVTFPVIKDPSGGRFLSKLA